jgi:hypothetical protein
MRPSGAGSDAQLHRIITRMCNRPLIVLLGCVFFQLLIDREVRAQVPSPDQSTPRAVSETPLNIDCDPLPTSLFPPCSQTMTGRLCFGGHSGVHTFK